MMKTVDMDEIAVGIEVDVGMMMIPDKDTMKMSMKVILEIILRLALKIMKKFLTLTIV